MGTNYTRRRKDVYAECENIELTSTAQTTLLQMTSMLRKQYRVSFYSALKGSTNETLNVTVTFTDPNLGQKTITLYNNTQTAGTPNSAEQIIYAQAGTDIIVAATAGLASVFFLNAKIEG